MKKSIGILFAVGLSGCTTLTKPVIVDSNPAQQQVNDMRKQTFSVLKENIAKSTPPLDMSEYKHIQFNIKAEKNIPVVQMQYQDFSKMMEMLHILGTRIEVQKAYLGTTMDLLEKDISNSEIKHDGSDQ